MRRIALFSDIHGNLPALDAVLDQVSAAGIRELFCLGDLVGYGPDPEGVIDRVRDRRILTVQGNYDEGIGHRRGECGCYYATDQARRDGEASIAFTTRSVDASHAAWLASLPAKVRFVEAGLHVLLVHGSPRKVNEYLLPDRKDDQLARLAAVAEADVVCVGHIHVPYHRLVPVPDGTVHYISTGSVGKPKDGDPRACWVELLIGDADEVLSASEFSGAAGLTDTFVGTVVHRVEYDVDSVVDAMLRAGLPATLAVALRSA